MYVEQTYYIQEQWRHFNFQVQDDLHVLLKTYGPHAAKIGTDAVVTTLYSIHSASDQERTSSSQEQETHEKRSHLLLSQQPTQDT